LSIEKIKEAKMLNWKEIAIWAFRVWLTGCLAASIAIVGSVIITVAKDGDDECGH
jgi:hypothetical protein